MDATLIWNMATSVLSPCSLNVYDNNLSDDELEWGAFQKWRLHVVDLERCDSTKDEKESQKEFATSKSKRSSKCSI